MADLKKLLNGLVQTKESLFKDSEKKDGVLYFVRTDAKGKEGYLYLNGREYGNVAELRKELEELVGTLPSGQTISEIFESLSEEFNNLENSVDNLAEVVETVEDKVASAETRISAVEDALEVLNGGADVEGSIEQKIKDAEKPVALSAATYEDAIAQATEKNIGQIIVLTQNDPTADVAGESGATAGSYIVTGAGTVAKVGTTTASGDLEGEVVALEGAVGTLTSKVNTLMGDEDVEGSVDQKIKDAIEALPADMVVESGRVEVIDGAAFLVLKIANQDEEVKISATDLVDTYTAGDDYVVVDGYEISLNMEKIQEVLKIDDLATKKEVQAVADDVEALEGEMAVLSGETAAIEDKVNELVDDYNEIAEALEDAIADAVKAGEFTKVSGGTVSVFVSEDEGNLIKAGEDGGLFAGLYYECYDEDDLEKTLDDSVEKPL